MGILLIRFLLPSTPQKKHGPNASRDQKRDAQIATQCGLNTKQIIVMLKLSQRQVLYALKTPHTPKKASG